MIHEHSSGCSFAVECAALLANPATVFFAVEVVPDIASRGGLALLAGGSA